MMLIGPAAELTILPEDDAVVFRATPLRRSYDLLLPVCMAGVGLYDYRHGLGWLTVAFFAAMAVFTLLRALWRGPEELRVNAGGMVSSRFGAVETKDIEGLVYRGWQETRPSGLYVRKRWGVKLMMSSVDREQAEQVIGVVRERFAGFAGGLARVGLR